VKRRWWGREPGTDRRSLRAELLSNLTFLAAAALFLGLWTASIFQILGLSFRGSAPLLALLVILDVLIFVALGRYLIDRLVMRPLAETTAVAEAIAGGDYERRAPEGPTHEIATLARAVNRLTDELLENQHRLAENVRSLDETNQMLNEAQRDLVQAEKMASIGRLAAGVAHEIGNPLGALIGYIGVTRRRGDAGEVVEGMEREARRIDQIVRGLLDYARPVSARREPVDVNASVERVLGLFRQQGKMDGIEVVTELDGEVPPIVGVPHRVDQMFVNLIGNAISAMEGVGRITVVSRRERYHPKKRLPARRADDPPGIDYSHLRRLAHGTSRESRALRANLEVAHIIVADSGPGIPADNISSIFEPFFTTKEVGEGTGLGLAIVAATAEELGGRIEVSSVEGGGATFHLYLPLSEARIAE
jgi:two-component system, NtrC family, sensor kinase